MFLKLKGCFYLLRHFWGEFLESVVWYKFLRYLVVSEL